MIRTPIVRDKAPEVYFSNKGTTIDISKLVSSPYSVLDNTDLVDGQPKINREISLFNPYDDRIIFDVSYLGLKLWQVPFPIEIVIGCDSQVLAQQGIGDLVCYISSQSNVGAKALTQSSNVADPNVGYIHNLGRYSVKFNRRQFTNAIGSQKWSEDFNYLGFGFYRTGGYSAISGITKANPAVVTCNAHGFTEGQTITLGGVTGMTQVNNKYFKVVNKTTNTFELYNTDDTPVDSTGYSTYASSGYCLRNLTNSYDMWTPTLGRAEKGNYVCLTADDGYSPAHQDMWDYCKVRGIPITFYPTYWTLTTPLITMYQGMIAEANSTYNAMWGKQMIAFGSQAANLADAGYTTQQQIDRINACINLFESSGFGSDCRYHFANENGSRIPQSGIDLLKSLGYKTNRTISQYYNYTSNYNAYPDALFNLFCMPPSSSPSGSYGSVIKNIQKNSLNKGGMTAILVHKIAAGGGSITQYTSEFQKMVNFLASDKKNIQAVTVPDWYNKIHGI